jgi:hypothetical protein
LSPAGYRDLFETIEPRIYGEAALLADVVAGGPLDLARHDPPAAVDADPALTIIASGDPAVYAPHPLDVTVDQPGEFRINPLYSVRRDGEQLQLHLQFPSTEYEEEYAACRQYLPDDAVVDAGALSRLQGGGDPGPLADYIRRHIIVPLPLKYC